MLIIEEVTLNTSSPVLSPSDKKMIRFSYNSVTIRSKQPGVFQKQNKINWTQNIFFPVIYNKPIDFEVFNQHSFGDNPQSLHQTFSGNFTIKKGQTFQDRIPVLSLNEEIQIGILQIKFRITSIIPDKVQKIMPKNQKIYIKSLIAHLPTIAKMKVYICIKIGDAHKQTSIAKSHGGEVVFTEGIQIDKSSFNKEILLTVFTIQEKTNEIKSVASGTLNVDNSFVQRKILLKNSQEKEVGTLFINARILTKKQSSLESVGLQKSKLKIVEPSKVKFYQQNPEKSRVLLYPAINSVDLAQRNPSQSSFKGLSSSRTSNSQQRMKKMTIMNGNNEIVFQKEERFKDYQDKQNPFVSYLNSRNELLLKQKHSGKFYKGAFIGYGDKTDFASKGSPGIGRYKLPSIWDRY